MKDNAMSSNVTINYTFEDDDGINPTEQPATFEFELNCSYSAGEKMVRYFSDGSGYPGSPPEVEILSVKLISVSFDEPVSSESQTAADNSTDAFQKWLYKYADDSDYLKQKVFELTCEQVEQDHYSYLADRQDY